MDALNAKFGKGGEIRFVGGPAEAPSALLTHPRTGDQVEIYLYGAHVGRWTNKSGEQYIFSSSKAVYEKGKAIRGGVPVIFPQFGPGKIQNHGFARNTAWEVTGSSVEDSGNVHLHLSLHASPYTLGIWNHPFQFDIEFILGAPHTLSFVLNVKNPGPEEFSFQTALHTYFTVSDIVAVGVHGLTNIEYIDKVKGGIKEVEKNDVVTINQEVDRVYIQVAAEVSFSDRNTGNSVFLQRQDFPDVVVWNPWIEKSKTLSDLGHEEYKNFVCVEVGHIAQPFSLSPGKQWGASHTIKIKGRDDQHTHL